MSYTRVWDEAVPTGAEQAADIDLLFRNLKQDLRERLNALVVDWTADPVVNRGGLFAYTAAAVTTGAVTTEVTLRTFSIPGGLLAAAAGVLRVTFIFATTGLNNTKRIRIKYGGSVFFDTTYLAGDQLSGAAYTALIWNDNATNVQDTSGTTPLPGATTTVGVDTGFGGAVDSTVAQNLVITGQCANAGDRLKSGMTMVEFLR